MVKRLTNVNRINMYTQRKNTFKEICAQGQYGGTKCVSLYGNKITTIAIRNCKLSCWV